MILQATPSAARLIIESVLNRALEVGRAGDDLLSNELLAIGEDLADQAQLPNIPEPERIEQ